MTDSEFISRDGAYGRVVGVQDVQTLGVLVDVLENVDLTPSGIVVVAYCPTNPVSMVIRCQTWQTYKAGQTPQACCGTWYKSAMNIPRVYFFLDSIRMLARPRFVAD